MKRATFFTGRKVLVSFLAFAAASLVINGSWIGVAAVRAASGGAAVPDMLFSYRPSELSPMFAAMGEAGRAAYLAMDAFDFAFAAAYGLFYFLAIGWAATRLFPARRGLRLLGALGLAGALCDEIENTVFRLGASGAAPIDGAPAAVASFASTAKYCFNYGSMALAAAGLAALGAATILRRPRSRG